MTSIVWAPGDLIVATNDGVDVRFAGVEITPDVPAFLGRVPGERGIRVQLAGVTSAETMELDSAYLSEMEAWGRGLKLHGKDSAGRPPVMPGETVLSAVKAVITDNHDTDYHCVAGQVAGTGSEWDGSWVFVPEPPEQVNHITIEFTLKGEPTGKSCRVQLD
ncbi:hypothetical protein [Arthrobacter sp. H35-D1]|uniref:hypothetical protein n=1 Tax=Arthrobacter sp. H35-D1 TaxID=3046202 RepID=UPI0024B9A118|nr:hypothetical protein [Arthrobacter sp. H35-D1]MDJ0313456.1 hypothetical protein [Arthrobacter sp. H35-D1]